MKVSVVVPVFKVDKYIRRCFMSVVSQSYKNIECIFIDDGSPDNCYLILKKLIEKYSGPINFKILKHEKNLGLSAARNTGTLAASGEFIYFLDSDDEITKNCINDLSLLALKYPGVEIVQGNTKTVPLQSNDWRNISLKNFPEFVDDPSWIKFHCFSKPKIPVNAWNKLINKRFILENNLYFYESIIHEDEHWMFFVSRNLKKICFTSAITYVHYINADSIIQSATNYKKIYSFYKIIEDLTGRDNSQFSVLERKYILKLLKNNMTKINIEDKERELLPFYRQVAKKIFNNSLKEMRFLDAIASSIFLMPRNFYCSWLGNSLSKRLIRMICD